MSKKELENKQEEAMPQEAAPQEISIDGFTISARVIASIVTQAVEKIDGVAYVVGHGAVSSLLALFSKQVRAAEGSVQSKAVGSKLDVTIPVAIFFGYDFPELAQEIRNAAAEALKTQIGVEVREVNVVFDQLIFPKD